MQLKRHYKVSRIRRIWGFINGNSNLSTKNHVQNTIRGNNINERGCTCKKDSSTPKEDSSHLVFVKDGRKV